MAPSNELVVKNLKLREGEQRWNGVIRNLHHTGQADKGTRSNERSARRTKRVLRIRSLDRSRGILGCKLFDMRESALRLPIPTQAV